MDDSVECQIKRLCWCIFGSFGSSVSNVGCNDVCQDLKGSNMKLADHLGPAGGKTMSNVHLRRTLVGISLEVE